MEAAQRSKPLTELPQVDVVVTMGCNVQCPSLPCKRREDWGLDDPTGRGDAAFLRVISTIEERILRLKKEFEQNKMTAGTIL